MKKLLPLLLVLIVSCNSTKNANGAFVAREAFLINATNCPENGTCTIELLPNKSLEFKKDDFGNSYPLISEGNKTVFKYTFTKNSVPNSQDSNYTELVYAELDSTISAKTLTNEALQNIKLHFGRLCFCKGQTGYYPIKNGNFKISKASKKAFKIDFNFKIDEVPQIISVIDEPVSIKSNESN